jgi:hypothetical protein
VKVLGMVKEVLSANDKANEDDSENDIEEEDIIDDENYMEKDEEDKEEDDEDNVDDDKVVRLASKNEEHSYQTDDSMILISFNENEDDEKLPKSQTPWLHQHIN